MGGSLLILAALWSTAHADCALLDDALGRAESSLIRLDRDDARQKLDVAESALDCDWMTGERLARLWLIEGALAAMSDDPDGAADAFVAAHSVDPDTWIEALGEDLRARYDRVARYEAAMGTVVTNGVGQDFQVRIDGAVAEIPATVRAGLHLVQIGRDEVDFAQVIFVTPGVTTSLQPDLPILPPTVDVRDADGSGSKRRKKRTPKGEGPGGNTVSFDLHLGAGVAGSNGEPLQRSTVTPQVMASEPAMKLRIPMEAGFGLRVGALWIRAAAMAGPMLDGQLYYLDDTEIDSALWLSGVFGSVGAAIGPVDLGVSGGSLLPSRPAARLVSNVRLGSLPVRLEARIGADWVAGTAEPAAGLFVVVQPRLIGRER